MEFPSKGEEAAVANCPGLIPCILSKDFINRFISRENSFKTPPNEKPVYTNI
jgi:hypothetical protein